MNYKNTYPTHLSIQELETQIFKKNYKSAILSNHRKSFRNKFIQAGMPVKNKGLIGSPPNTTYSESDFWRGVFDGNGSLGFTKTNEPFISLATKSIKLKTALCELLSTKFDIHKNIEPNKRDHIYNIVLKNEDAIQFCDFLYENSNICLQRKYNAYLQIKTWTRTKKRIKQQSWSKNEITYIQEHSIEESMQHLNRSKQSIKMKLWRIRQSNNLESFH